MKSGETTIIYVLEQTIHDGVHGERLLFTALDAIRNTLRLSSIYIITLSDRSQKVCEVVGLGQQSTGSLHVEMSCAIPQSFHQAYQCWTQAFDSGLPYFINDPHLHVASGLDFLSHEQTSAVIPLSGGDHVWGFLLLPTHQARTLSRHDDFHDLLRCRYVVSLVMLHHYRILKQQRSANSKPIKHSYETHVAKSIFPFPSDETLAVVMHHREPSYHERLVSSLFEHTSNGVWIRHTDQDGLLYVNQALATILGLSYGSIESKLEFDFIDYIHPDDRPRVVRLLAKNTTPLTIEWRFVTGTGEIRWVRVKSFPISENATGGIITDITEQRVLQSETQAITPQSVSQTEIRILYVEDNHILQMMASHILHRFQLDNAYNADEALRLVANHAYDLIFIDISLGEGIDGAELCQLIRSNPLQSRAYFVAATANEEFRSHQKLTRHGFDNAIIKPFNANMLHRIIQIVQERNG
jgi:PAS domain S-box-containing protein